MSKFRLKGSISDEDFMIHILNNLPEEYDAILDGLEYHLMSHWDNGLITGVIHKKLNHRCKTIKDMTVAIFFGLFF